MPFEEYFQNFFCCVYNLKNKMAALILVGNISSVDIFPVKINVHRKDVCPQKITF